jgi:hypothetical protein
MNRFFSKLGPFKWTFHLVYLLSFRSRRIKAVSQWVHDVTAPEQEEES